MTDGLWRPTKRVRLTRTLEAAIEVAARDGGDAAHLRALLAARTADEQWHVVVGHVGSPDDPLLWDKIAHEQDSAKAKCRAQARRELKAEDDPVAFVFGDVSGMDKRPTLEDAIMIHSTRMVGWSDALSKAVRDRIIAGCQGGEATYERVYALGGPRLLIEAHEAVVAFNSIGGDLGEN